MFRGLGMSYYWSAFQTYWATDTAFASPAALVKFYLQLVRGAIATCGSQDFLRFLGKRPDPRYQGEVLSDYKDRPEGVCVKHRAYGNSVKVYDKGGSILRVETTINHPDVPLAHYQHYLAALRKTSDKKARHGAP